MQRFRSLHPSAVAASASLWRWLGVCTFGAALLAASAWAQQPLPLPPAPVATTSAATAPSAEALALDKRLIDEANKGSEIMTNLTYLSDIIGPRLTGSAALKRANEWAAEKMRGYGLTNVRLEP